MTYLSDSNKFLKVSPGVVLTPVIDYSIHEVDPFFEHLPAVVTSGLRDPAAQLRVIRQYSLAKGVDKLYPAAMQCDVNAQVWSDEYHQMIYAWQLAWSKLLNVGVVINPPFAAPVLLDYFGPTGKGYNRKGSIIHQSPHTTGCAYNLGGGGNGPQDELACIEAAIKAGVKSIESFLLERENNCLHINARKV